MGVLGIRQKGTRHTELVATLTQLDLCDCCPAAAHAVVVLPLAEGEDPSEPHAKTLLFCSHHLNKHQTALEAKGATVYRKENK